jgi:hypothetical protein
LPVLSAHQFQGRLTAAAGVVAWQARARGQPGRTQTPQRDPAAAAREHGERQMHKLFDLDY